MQPTASRSSSSSLTSTAEQVEGIDKLTFDEHGSITELKVMLRPASGLAAVATRMAEELPRVGLTVPG